MKAQLLKVWFLLISHIFTLSHPLRFHRLSHWKPNEIHFSHRCRFSVPGPVPDGFKGSGPRDVFLKVDDLDDYWKFQEWVWEMDTSIWNGIWEMDTIPRMGMGMSNGNGYGIYEIFRETWNMNWNMTGMVQIDATWSMVACNPMYIYN